MEGPEGEEDIEEGWECECEFDCKVVFELKLDEEEEDEEEDEDWRSKSGVERENFEEEEERESPLLLSDSLILVSKVGDGGDCYLNGSKRWDCLLFDPMWLMVESEKLKLEIGNQISRNPLNPTNQQD